MTEAREAELLRHVATLGQHSEAVAFRHALTGRLMAALVARIDLLADREGMRPR